MVLQWREFDAVTQLHYVTYSPKCSAVVFVRRREFDAAFRGIGEVFAPEAVRSVMAQFDAVLRPDETPNGTGS